ncbi:helix-turn-helix domain-containing protein [Tardiphaga sp. P9-11]|uniref:helix-turn-helix transcriptional regulator n=1 Tax=Tardiphaga sp. P9-11 TaxID=2024614 RepID=UPI0011F142AD|nr:helix-turn-helix domain-containing protein [Tardiphaga sp. P9-11]KAA0069506.1 helix-turn-helix domain-containing protein [Tardiphaga sp. P9-11]
MYAHPKLLKAARQTLDITQSDLAAAADVSVRSLAALEANKPRATLATIEAVQFALVQTYGVTFLGEDQTFGAGFRLPRGFGQKKAKGDRPISKSRAGSKRK